MTFDSEGKGFLKFGVYVLFPSSAPGTPPRNIQAKGLSDTSFEATWLPPSQPNGEILGYRLYYVTDPKLKIDQWLYRASADNQTQITGLLKTTTYYFKLIAYNSAGEGPLSDLFAVKTAQGGEMLLFLSLPLFNPWIAMQATGCSGRSDCFSLLLDETWNKNKTKKAFKTTE